MSNVQDDLLYDVLRRWFVDYDIPVEDGSQVAQTMSALNRLVRACRETRRRGPRAVGVWEELYDALEAVDATTSRQDG